MVGVVGCLLLTSSCLFRASARRYGDATNRWARVLLKRGDTMGAAHAFAKGVGVFESVNGKVAGGVLGG